LQVFVIGEIENGDKPYNAREVHNVHSTYRLNRKNHFKWSHLIKTVLKREGKASHFSDAPAEDDPSPEDCTMFIQLIE